MRAEAPHANGFTLLEMMVALAIFALAALSLMKLQSYSLRSAGDVRGASMAELTLENIAAETLTDPASLAVGRTEGRRDNGGRTWRYVMAVEPSAAPSLMRIDLSVEAADSGPGRAQMILTRPAALQ